ncbi:nitrate- and nitrite sensing domain-containing protein [Streptomyces sp. H28]|uniref:sensor histidine kinase n=1 Tax=Streptomyces sp. H28 TaxID=2775865 RepID=UPI00177BD9D2|nr:nitrate- and nitrite sensing domain-containing protein [Streptomyces sp. H28]MBD9732092.1 nitrate- and nitrite sensing domain-containing protein [Streptomyces sp. H28]
MRRSKNSPEPSARGNFTPPPRTAAPAHVPEPEPASAPPPSGGRFSPRNWRVTTRLNAILLIPVLVGLVMGGFQVSSSIETWQEAEDAEKVALLVRAADDYGQALLNERDLTAADLLSGKGETEQVKKLRAATDAAKEEFDRVAEDLPNTAALDRRMQLFRTNETGLGPLREKAYTASMDPVKTEEGYVAVQHSLMEFANELGLGTENVTSYGRTVYAVSLAKAAASLQRSIGVHLLVRPSQKPAVVQQQRVSLVSYRYLEGIAINEFVSAATEGDVERLDAIMAQKRETIGDKGAAVGAGESSSTQGGAYTAMPAADNMLQGLASGALSEAQLKENGITLQNWLGAYTAKFAGYSEVESELVDKAVEEAQTIADNAKRDALITGAAVVIALLAAFILAGMVARQMSRSMRQLRNAAFGIAEQRLPMLVDQLSRTDPGRVDTRVAPIPITSTDEIGEVARAFDQVHREAVRLASEQALLRGNINAIFTNLSRRNQSLIEGQLTLLTDLENNEADPDQLENLFRLDHLATRMRRNGENLLVLAGEEPGRRWDQPVPLVDVIRAASSEVEQYERIELSGVPEAEIHGRAVTDLVHLLAELLENATTFSSPQTKVRVTATRLPDGRVMIEIHDKGIGLTAEDFADINHKLANPPTVDAAISQRMGLFVVGRLSDRHGIRVQLRPSGEQAGTTSLVMLPDAITHGGGGEQQPAHDEFTVSQIIPEQNYQGEDFNQQPLRTAAELGFDDSRYTEVPDDIRDLDPVGRSLMREGRRAALEGTQQSPDAPAQHEDGSTGEFAAPQGYDPGQGYDRTQGYDDGGYRDQQQTGTYEQPQQPVGYDQQAYDTGDQQAYDTGQQSSYDGGYYAPAGQAPQNDAFASNGAYPDTAYPEAPASDRTPAGASSGSFPGFDDRRREDDWPQADGYQNGYPAQYPADAQESESTQAADAGERDGVGFDRPGPAHSAVHELTDAGLPRRGSTASGATGGARHAGQEAPASPPENNGDSSGWRSANDERWQQASQLRKPKAGGVTSSGLPRRVPKANLVQGSAETTPQGGPQVSRAPEDVRGRLSNLRRGVQRGRNAGSETNGQGFGPDSTYNQER